FALRVDWRLGTLRRRHELRTDGIGDRCVDGAFDQRALGVIERPACNTERCPYLIGVTAAPERDADTLVEHPTHGQMDDPPVKTALCELIELPNGLEILR